VRERCDATTLEFDTLVIACGPWSAQVGEAAGVELPVRPLCRQLLATGELDLPDALPMVLEAETGFHFRRRGSRLVLAMTDPEPRWGFDEVVDESLFADRLHRLQHRYPPAAAVEIEDA
jgi:glycine/D-amino acid oxidase-like deaminating enzyme